MSHRRRRNPASRSTPIGAAPGTIVSDPNAEPTKIEVIRYDLATSNSKETEDPQEAVSIIGPGAITWIHVTGLRDTGRIQKLAELLHLHPLAIEDMINLHQRAKAEEYEGYLFLISQIAASGKQVVDLDQVSFVVAKEYVLSVSERQTEALEAVRERILARQGRICSMGTDYLMYRILDAVIDTYFPVTERFGDELDEFEDQIATRLQPAILDYAYDVKRQLLVVRRTLWQHRDMLNYLMGDVSPLVQQDTRVYLRDCYDHIVRLIDLSETYRELGSDLMNLYLSSVNNKMNEVMKQLAVVATIFMPLSFVAGVYGMNFNLMPEVTGLWMSWAIFILLGVGIAIWFRRRGFWQSYTSIEPDEKNG